MWGSMEPLIDRLSVIHLDERGTPLDLLESFFGNTRFVHIKRDDVLAQAVSWLRAEQTGTWHVDDPSVPAEETGPTRFDYHELRRYASLIESHNAAWTSWFADVGVEPYVLKYEDLDADRVGTTRSLLQFLGLRFPARVTITASNVRMADDVTSEWKERYKAMATAED